jgi:ABC-2 type transport system permease protein
MTLRLRLPFAATAVFGLIAVLLVVGALFPAVGHSIGKLAIPKGVAQLLGGADYGTITGWYRSEMASIYGPLLIAAVAIIGASASTAGEEEDRILGLVLAHPVERSRLIVAKAAAIATIVVIVAIACWVGLIAGVALAGGGITVGHLAAYCLQLAFFGFVTGAVALAFGAGSGRRALANAAAAGVAVIGWLINGFAPLVSGLGWLKYLSLFYYYEGNDPLAHGVDVPNMIVLGAVTLLLTAVAAVSIGQRDLRA